MIIIKITIFQSFKTAFRIIAQSELNHTEALLLKQPRHRLWRHLQLTNYSLHMVYDFYILC